MKEFLLFINRPMCDKVNSVVGVLQLLVWKNLVNSFPNVYIAPRIYLSIWRRRLYWRADIFCTKTREKLSVHRHWKCKMSALALLSIECDIVRKPNIHEITKQFVLTKWADFQEIWKIGNCRPRKSLLNFGWLNLIGSGLGQGHRICC